MKNLILITVLTFVFSIANAQVADNNTPTDLDSTKSEPISIGGYLGGQINFHSPDFRHSYYFDNISNFNENSNSLGLNIGLLINYPIYKNYSLSGRIGYHAIGTTLDGNSLIGGTPDTTLANSIDASLGYLEISPLLKVNELFPIKELYLIGGFELSIPLVGSYSFESSISNVDSTITFPNGERDMTDFTDFDMPDKSMRFALVMGAGYNFELNNNWTLSPELSFRMPFTNVSSNANLDSWSVPQLRLGVNLTYNFEEEPPPPDPLSTISVDFKGVYFHDKNSNKQTATKINVEEVQYAELFPIVPYIFNDLNSEFPSKRTQTLATESAAGQFSINQLNADAIGINNSTLDIIGTRLQKYPKAKLTIIGSLDGAAEKGNIELAQKRADFAKMYLVANYSANADNIKTIARELPKNASTTRVADGVEENRRIEIQSNFPEILEPILITKEKQTFSEPKAIEFETEIKSTDSIKTWEFEISQAARLIKRISGSGKPGDISWSIKPNSLSASEVPVDYTLTAENTKGKLDSKSGTLPIYFNSYSKSDVEETPDKLISKYSLIVFDFNSPEISEDDENILKKNVLSSIKYNSTVQIYGYSDRIGDEDYNQKLALKRAERVKKYLQSKASKAKYEVYGIGEEMEIFDNNLPIGRHLSRTVQIYVITPKEN